ncbi:GNAT family N-acetyltransferase [Janibacter melonis]|uniref:GNAT family N-acetyltransferase n=1 Tax=Janibacter melonis TaxID=262209 RepID=UPI001917C1F5|nr:GNAT family N-acetyltransferase [Janibacter melonis]
MLTDLWPTFGIRITTPRLTLRLARESELADLAQLAAKGVHRPDERPFLTPWAEGSGQDRAREVLVSYWDQLSTWEPDAWRLSLTAFREDLPVGVVSLRSRDFAVTREVTTSSWLGLEHQGQGLGTEGRAGVLALAFDHLGATDATTEVFTDNHASQGVSRVLGYLPDGISRDRRDDEVLVSDRLRLTADRWRVPDGMSVAVEGVGPARPMFGLQP